MADELQATAAPEATEAPRVDTFDYGTPADSADAAAQESAPAADASAEWQSVLSATSENAPPVDTTEDVEFEGKQYKVDKALKEALMRNADYTRKTQEVAEARRAVEARQAQVEQQAQIQATMIAELGKLHNIDTQLAEFDKIDWDVAATQSDPTEVQKAFIRQQNLRNERANLAQALQQKEYQQTQIRNQQAFEAQQEAAKRFEEGQAILRRDIPGWSPEMGAKLKQFALEDGWTPEQVSNITPAQVKSLHKAHAGYQLMQKQSTTPPVKPPPPPIPKVGGGGAASSKTPSEMTMAEYAKFRRAQR